MTYGTQRFKATLTRTLQYPDPEPNQVNSLLTSVSSRFILIFFSHRYLFLKIIPNMTNLLYISCIPP